MDGVKTIYTTGEAAKVAHVSQQTIIRCFDAGQLKGFRVPGSKFRRIPRAALFAFLVANGIPTDNLGELLPHERTAIAALVMGPVRVACDRGVAAHLDALAKTA